MINARISAFAHGFSQRLVVIAAQRLLGWRCRNGQQLANMASSRFPV